MTSVAIVMRTYERPLLLARALTSVCQQSFRDWHLVVVNNGGDPAPVDDMVAVARVANPSAAISVLHLAERVGMEEASNRGLAAVDSEFFAIHDDDDTWRPEFLDVAVSTMHAHPDASAVVTGVVRVHETFSKGRVWPVQNEKFYLVPERLTFEGMIGNNTFPPIAALFRRSLLQRVGLFDASLPVLGDWEFNLRAVEAGPFVFVPQRLANYHTRTPDSDVASGNSITVGQELHRRIKRELQQRWDSEPGRDGVSKGELSRRETARIDAEDAAREQEESRSAASGGAAAKVARVARALRRPRAAGRGVVRRIRVRVGR
jgi:glycosyltransferase involved in cell wall biosynthesis